MLQDLLARYPRILAECAVAERLRRIPSIELHPTLFNTPLIYGPDEARESMRNIYREYLNIAYDAKLPLLLTAPTWRLDASRVAHAKVPPTINQDAVAFLDEIRHDGPSHSSTVALGALVGPKSDCYRPELAPQRSNAKEFHSPQIEILATTRADFLLAQTLPALGEATGIAQAMASTGKPYIISFCIGTDGNVLDGTPLPEAMARIDESPNLTNPPIGFFVNCTHPTFLLKAYQPGQLNRLIGIQANGSSKDVTRLDGSATTQADPVSSWAQAMLELHQTHQVTILGGCCGTSTSHLQALASGVIS